jgi:hypothetical protein
LYVSLTGKDVQNANHQPANSRITQPQFPTQMSQQDRLLARILQSNRHRRQVRVIAFATK